MKKKELECILKFMYLGETNIDQDSIQEFFNVANSFRVKQLEQQLLPHIDDEWESVDTATIPPDDTSNMTQDREFTKLVLETENINSTKPEAEPDVEKKNNDNHVFNQTPHLVYQNQRNPS